MKWFLVLGVLGTGGALAYSPIYTWWKTRTAPQFRTAPVVRGDIVSVINATGTVNPVLSVRVGSFVSGPVARLHVDFNSRVKKDGLLVEIEPDIYEAIQARDEASLELAKAEVGRVQALLEQAKNDEKRAERLRAKNPDYLSDSEMDKLHFNRVSLEAQLRVAKAQVLQAEASLRNSKKNLNYTKIKSPVDGVVIDRKIDEGQTLVAQFQVPDLFVVAPDLEKEIHVYASVDEADVGLIREAQRRNEPVYFTVDAYPDDLFEGRIHQIRMNSTVKENVVTYNVVVSTSNPDLKLLPGMTAKLSFQVAKRPGVLKVPNAALRFYPKPPMVRDEDKKLLEATEEETTESASGDKSADARSAVQRILDRKTSNRRHVWVLEGERLRAIEVVVGLSDHKHTEVVSGDVEEGMELVTSVK
ncbi:MAG: efflux RND transporter periplasmic adaptor subunit [Thermoguttaceae bacterium]|nr:efflux RND transporter periplasmic adaptor subunit [Thermoguttaceae bacterium]